MLSGAGFGTVTATQLTIDDVRAADSDQVPIKLDTEGRYTKMVPSDWYDRLTKARQARNRLNERFKNKKGVVAVGLSAGRIGGENPFAIVHLDKESDQKEERRGEIPERSNGVEVKIGELKNGKANCESGELNSDDQVPGGPLIQSETEDGDEGGYLTVTSRAMTGSLHGYDRGWLTAAHGLPRCSNIIPSDVYHPNSGIGGERIGTIEYVDFRHDFVYIEQDGNSEPLSDIAKPDNPDKIVAHIKGTMSEDGVSHWESEEYDIRLRGNGSCYATGKIHSHGNNPQTQYAVDGFDCTDRIYDQIFWGQGSDVDEGDSGGLTYTPDPYGDDDFAVCLHTGKWQLSLFGDAMGTAGYAIRDHHNMWWR